MSTLMFSHEAERPSVVLSFGHLILLIIYELFKPYTGAAGSYKCREEAHRPVFVEYCHLKIVSTGIRFLKWFLFFSEAGGLQ